ncbi:hypothetical protein MRX96_046618 [Rhipicephalus microplus]
MASAEEHQELAVGSSGASDCECSATGSLAGPLSPEAPGSALEEGEVVAERKSKEAAVQEEEGAVHSPEPASQQHLTENISTDAAEAAPAVPMAKKCLNSRSMEPLEGELDFEDDAPPESPSGTSLDKAPSKENKGGKTKADLEEGEAEDDDEVSDVSGTELTVQDDDLEEGELPEGAGGGTGATRINDRGNYNMFATVPKPPLHHNTPPLGGPAAVMRGGAPPPEFLGPPNATAATTTRRNDAATSRVCMGARSPSC